MRLILLVTLLYSLPGITQTTFYELNLTTAYGGELSMSHYQGQKVVVATVDIQALRKKAALEFWDSLKTANPKVAFILIPANDLDTLADDSTAMREIKGKAPEKIILSEAGKVKKDKGEHQLPMMQWLTDIKKNKHFEMEIESDMQMYVISGSGVLYAVLSKDTRLSVLDESLKHEDVKPSVFDEMRP